MLYKNLVASIPEGAIIMADRRVFWTIEKKYVPDKRYNLDKRKLIGKALEESPFQMYPNDNYIALFPDDYQALLKGRPSPSSQSIGLYLVVKEIAERLSLYRILYDVFGKEDADLILDYAMYQILSESTSSLHYEAALKDKAIFSERLRSDSYLSAFFKTNINDDKTHLFLETWAPRIIAIKKISKAYIHVDGSNDCETQGVSITEEAIKEVGADKFGEDTCSAMIMYVVAPDGTPVYFIPYRGGIIDSKAVKAVQLFFKHFKAKINIFCAGKGSCTKDGIAFLREMNIGFVLMMADEPEGFATGKNKMREAIRGNMDKWIEGTELFGDKVKGKLFKEDTLESYLHIYFDSEEAGKAIETLLGSINRAKARALKAIQCKKEPRIPEELKEFLHLRKGQGPKTLVMEYDKIQEAVNGKGMHVIVTSEDMDTLEAYRVYHTRDSSERQYLFMKSELGLEKYYAGNDKSIPGKQFVAFIAGIIRNELHLASQKMTEEKGDTDKYSVSALIRELIDIKIKRLPGNEYAPVMNLSLRDEFMLKHLGITKEKLDECVKAQKLRIQGRNR